MEKPDTADVLHRIAARMRAEAGDTQLEGYRQLMLRTAASLDAEARRIEIMAIAPSESPSRDGLRHLH